MLDCKQDKEQKHFSIQIEKIMVSMFAGSLSYLFR